MPDYSFLDERPRHIRGVARQVAQFLEITAHLDEDLRFRNIQPGTEDEVVSEWFGARSKAIEWAQIVCRRRDEARHDGLAWWPSSPYVHSASQLQLFPTYAESLRHLGVQLDAWADEIDLFEEPISGAWVFVGGEPYSAWQKCREVIASTTGTLMLVDSYVERETLDLLLSTPGSAEVRVLTMKEELPSDFPTDWKKWVAQRGGEAQCRALSRTDMPHDRFLLVDGRV